MKRQSIKLAILIPLLITLLIGIAGMTIFAAVMSTNAVSDVTDQLIEADIKLGKLEFTMFKNGILNDLESLAPIIDGASDESNPRGDALEILTDYLLSSSDEVLCIWTAWEPNAFDGADSLFVDTPMHDSTGRFVPFVFKTNTGVDYDALTDYDHPVDGEYYQGALNSGQVHMTDLYYYEFGGREVLIGSIAVPIFRDGAVAGVLGADFNIDSFLKTLNSVQILDDGYLALISPTGIFSSHPNEDLLTKHYNTTWLSDYSQTIEEIIRNGGSYHRQSYSADINANVMLHLEAIEYGAARRGVIVAVVPVSTIMASTNTIVTLMVIIGVAIVLIIGTVVYVITHKQIGKQLPPVATAAEELSIGNIELDEYMDDTTYPTKNEVTLLKRSFTKMIRSFKEQAFVLTRVAEGDYTSHINIRSEKDVINLAIDLMTKSTLDVLNQVATAGIQVSDASKQLAEGSQLLAQGSTEQAATVEELSASMLAIAEKTKENAGMAGKAAALAESIKNNAEKGNHQMSEMMDAVKDINQASQNINKVMKVIDDIAFQTNILALNAAVEAARAGQHGKGFAVVAEEVRNLAAKSAEAAKESGVLISNSIEKAELGSQIATNTASSLEEIVSGINESTQIVNDIAVSSNEQYESIEQIHKSVEQVAEVVHQNSATAQQSAAASQQMSGQSEMLEKLIMQFQLREQKYRQLGSGDRK